MTNVTTLSRFADAKSPSPNTGDAKQHSFDEPTALLQMNVVTKQLTFQKRFTHIEGAFKKYNRPQNISKHEEE